jgi:hypothetical protein
METYIQFAEVAIGVGCLIWSGVSYFRITKFLQRCTETRGEVVRLERTGSGAGLGNYDYAPVFCFETASGESITVTSEVGSNPPGFTEGQSVRVRYDPSNPSDARIHSFLQTWGEFVIPVIVGIFFLGVVASEVHPFAR